MTGTLPQWCADIISSPPRSGEGFHNWLFRAGRGLWKCGRHENDIREFLQNAAASCAVAPRSYAGVKIGSSAALRTRSDSPVSGSKK